ncbi:helix-turn-helix domain-containing protein [Streptomyces beigongshangae]|uniref:helix-turn-helix domain-containing protein n=1 Tax=Streptomyces beigongshangae TaxID=2841597 RepID=UPI001C84D879|nr:helix-turn-helix domain-containing protein [Streptomyces sp. REN17]
MFETVFRSEAVPAAERFNYCREHLGRRVLPMELYSDRTDAFWMEQRFLQLGAAFVVSSSFDPLVFRRSTKMIKQADPESIRLVLPLDGTFRSLGHHDQVTVCRPRELILLDSSRPFEFRSAPHRSVIVGIEISKALISLPRSKTDQVMERTMPGGEGIGALLAGFATQLASCDTSQYASFDGLRLESVVADLVTALLARANDADDLLSPETHQRTLTLRIRAFIQHNLHDPELTPSVIAAAHHISVSHLHRIFRDFRQEGVTVAAWIRSQRLKRARRDLADPALRDVSVHRLATRWGFTHHATFTRAFRVTYGLTPQDYRRQELDL